MVQFLILALVGFVGVFGVLWLTWSGIDLLKSLRGTDSGVEDVRRSPRETIQAMTVEEFQELGFDFLRSQGFELITRTLEDDHHVVATRDGAERLVRVDPAAELENPRAVNQLQVQVQKFDLDGIITITTAELPDQNRNLLERMEARILGPEALVEWQRSPEQE